MITRKIKTILEFIDRKKKLIKITKLIKRQQSTFPEKNLLSIISYKI